MSLDDEGDVPSVDPYAELELEVDATDVDVRKAYRKLALRYHPDKVSEKEKKAAQEKFQRIAASYAILVDDKRRARYDATGSTSESLFDVDDDFSWSDFYESLFEKVTTDRINDFSNTYKGSEEERGDLLKAYKNFNGSMTKIYQNVMLSDMLLDEDRFRKVIDAAIEKGEIPALDGYTGETEKQQQKRVAAARKQRKEAEDRESKSTAKNAKAKKPDKDGGLGDLAAMIQAKKSDRGDAFLERLAQKYAATSKGGKKRAPPPVDEPSEEDFERMAKRKTVKAKK